MRSLIPYEDVFKKYRPFIEAGDGLNLSQVCSISNLEPSTIQNWIKRGFVPHPVRKKYHARHLARILLISTLRDGLQIDKIGKLLSYVNGVTDDESDDIISEEELYDRLCSVLHSLDFKNPEVPALVSDELADYRAPDRESALRLEKALSIMTYAYISGCYRNKSDELLSELV